MSLLLLALQAAQGAQASRCAAESGPQTTALVELYTSQRCSGCLQAEARLGALAAGGGVIAVLLHVDERNYVAGARDPLARRRLTPRQRLALHHAPALLLQGRAFEAWAGPQLEQAVSDIGARPAAARLRLEAKARGQRALHVRAFAEVQRAATAEAALYLAAYAERGGQRVALEWQGPFALRSGRLYEERLLPLVPGAPGGRAGVVGFVQDRRGGEVLQALILGAC